MDIIKSFIRDVIADDGFIAGEFVRKHLLSGNPTLHKNDRMHCVFYSKDSMLDVLLDNHERLDVTNLSDEFILLDDNKQAIITIVCSFKRDFIVNNDIDRLVCASDDFNKLFFWSDSQVFPFHYVAETMDY